MTRMSTFLMFGGRAKEAMAFYQSLFPGARAGTVDGTRPEGADAEGSLPGVLEIGGHRLMLFDSPTSHPFGFTPAISLFVDCDDGAEIDRLFAALSDGGQVMMPLGEYPFARRFGWTADRFGVSWQLSLT